ncbi:MAG: hypothetical protein KAR19_11315 [Bacteroidales bacterium]|nr:hypothetical protein [Bacteroidales bacterium]
MKRMLTGIIIGLVTGIIIGMLILFFSSPSLMFREDLSKKNFDTTVARVEEVVVAKGWKIPYVQDCCL